jgi:DNA-binding NarL/FixJ family response regulator
VIRVLVADDQEIVREGIRRLLELTGKVEVVADAADGEQALERIAATKPQVALLDVRMPRKDGVQVVQALRAQKDNTPVILLTTFDDDALLAAGVKAGIAGFLLKDVSVEDLTQALETVARGGTLILPAMTRRAQRYVQAEGVQFEASELPDPLTPREREVLRLIAGGYSNREIGDLLGTTEGTVKNQASTILSKLGVRDRTRAVLKAIELGWLAHS